MSTRRLTTAAGFVAAAAGFAYTAYRRDITRSTDRIEIDRQVIESADGPIEFAEAGDGPAALVIHGAGGGFDQGLDLGREFLGERLRIIAPSRFGYLGTPLRADASPEAQADAHVRVLDALQLGRVPVIAVSAGAPSAMQLSLRYPDRCSALVLIVPLTYPTQLVPRRSAAIARVLKAITASDLAFWTAMKLARSRLVETILGVPLAEYRNATRADRRIVNAMLRGILPISRRAAGILNDATIGSTLTRYRLEEISIPTLVIAAADCLYGTYRGSIYTAEHIPDATLVAFAKGGHLLVGHDAEVRLEIAAFFKRIAEDQRSTAVAM